MIPSVSAVIVLGQNISTILRGVTSQRMGVIHEFQAALMPDRHIMAEGERLLLLAEGLLILNHQEVVVVLGVDVVSVDVGVDIERSLVLICSTWLAWLAFVCSSTFRSCHDELLGGTVLNLYIN